MKLPLYLGYQGLTAARAGGLLGWLPVSQGGTGALCKAPILEK